MTTSEANEYCLLKAEQNDIDYNEVLTSYDLRVRLSLYTEDQLTKELMDDIFNEVFL